MTVVFIDEVLFAGFGVRGRRGDRWRCSSSVAACAGAVTTTVIAGRRRATRQGRPRAGHRHVPHVGARPPGAGRGHERHAGREGVGHRQGGRGRPDRRWRPTSVYETRPPAFTRGRTGLGDRQVGALGAAADAGDRSRVSRRGLPRAPRARAVHEVAGGGDAVGSRRSPTSTSGALEVRIQPPPPPPPGPCALAAPAWVAHASPPAAAVRAERRARRATRSGR